MWMNLVCASYSGMIWCERLSVVSIEYGMIALFMPTQCQKFKAHHKMLSQDIVSMKTLSPYNCANTHRTFSVQSH